MKNSPDPSLHRQREQQIMRHVERLLGDERLRIDTARGRRPVADFQRTVNKTDKAVDLKRLMSDLGKPDRELQARMPVGEAFEVTLTRKKWWIFTQTVGQLRVLCASPTRQLLEGSAPTPMDTAAVRKTLGEIPPASDGVPLTVAIVSTSGFTREAHEIADRGANRTVLLIEPNDAGGWSVYGPVETKALADLFDPEAEEEKRDRVRQAIDAAKFDLIGSGVATDKLAAKLQLPLSMVEAEVKSYAKANPGLAAKRLDGRVVLFRQGAAAPLTNTAGATSVLGGSDMPLIDRLKTLFARKGEHEKKIAFLAERRTALSQQRDRSYEEMDTLEKQEDGLRTQFKESTSGITKRRVTSQLLQLRKDIERRQQLLTVLNQQINVVSTHLHNLELVQQGQSAKLPDSEEMASDAAAAEEVLATLQADVELADSVGSVAHAGMSAEEQALYEELEREAGGVEATSPKVKLDNVAPEEEIEPPPRQTTAERPQPRRTEPEAG